ncbi:MAG: dihydrofolate reductase family protein [Solirubrobacteraceae bacterium]
MTSLVLKMSVSLDGYVAPIDGSSDWVAAGRSEDGAKWTLETVSNAGTHLIGAATYARWASCWPGAAGPFAPLMNGIPKVVFSGSLATADWGETTIATGELTAAVTRLKQERATGYLLVQGGVRFARSLAATGLIDEYRLVVHPVVLGAGERLFAAPLTLEPMSTTAFSGGAVRPRLRGAPVVDPDRQPAVTLAPPRDPRLLSSSRAPSRPSDGTPVTDRSTTRRTAYPGSAALAAAFESGRKTVPDRGHCPVRSGPVWFVPPAVSILGRLGLHHRCRPSPKSAPVQGDPERKRPLSAEDRKADRVITGLSRFRCDPRSSSGVGRGLGVAAVADRTGEAAAMSTVIRPSFTRGITRQWHTSGRRCGQRLTRRTRPETPPRRDSPCRALRPWRPTPF